MDLKEKVLDYKDEVVKEIQNAVRVRSVKEAPLPGMPFGEGPAKALEHFMDLAKKLGFKAEKFDNYAMHIDISHIHTQMVNLFDNNGSRYFFSCQFLLKQL